jgi:hypothetical protein
MPKAFLWKNPNYVILNFAEGIPLGDSGSRKAK